MKIIQICAVEDQLHALADDGKVYVHVHSKGAFNVPTWSWQLLEDFCSNCEVDKLAAIINAQFYRPNSLASALLIAIPGSVTEKTDNGFLLKHEGKTLSIIESDKQVVVNNGVKSVTLNLVGNRYERSRNV